MSPLRFRPVCAGVVVLGALVTGCGPSDPVDRTPGPPVSTPVQVSKTVTAGPRRDVEPVVARFPLLTGARVDAWAAGTLGGEGTGRVPGPSTYWFDAVVDVGTDRVTRWSELYDTRPVAAPGASAEVVRPWLPTGRLLGGPELDRAFSSAQWDATVYLSPATGRVVVLGLDD
ncbi:hypothetical protein [Gordonia sp. 'Campus']|uniref:hypothetical protein n=1 Tax=Gordonia sp. 'Campus' TaxID=2915824 RepID=UPI001EE47324|nr:hypothetical protein [Gordonia sp. 'Campus']